MTNLLQSYVLNFYILKPLVLPLYSYISLNLSLLSKGQPTSPTLEAYLYLHAGRYLLPIASANPGVDIGGWSSWVLPSPLSPAWGHRIEDSPITQLFFIPTLLQCCGSKMILFGSGSYFGLY